MNFMTSSISAAILLAAALVGGCGQVDPASFTADAKSAPADSSISGAPAVVSASGVSDSATTMSATTTPSSGLVQTEATAATVNPLLTRTVRIWALGDSMTRGDEANPLGYRSYRGRLFSMLRDAGYQIDFVGTNQSTPAVGGDPDNDGYGGAFIGPGGSANNLDGKLDSLLPAIEADIVILAFGWNSVYNEPSGVGATKYAALVDRIAAAKPNAHLIVATLSPQKGQTEEQTNSQLPGYYALNEVARSLANTSHNGRIHLADFAAGGFVAAEYWDVIHWLQPGADRAAKVIFETLIKGPLRR